MSPTNNAPLALPNSAPLTLRALIAAQPPDPGRIAAFLDDLAQHERVAAIRGLRRSELQRLFGATAGARRLTLGDLVPPELPPYTPVRHFGRNSLPAFSLFEKRFYRTAERELLGGANFQTLSPLTGPGYFSARADEAHGEVLIDYQRLPDRAPEGWPAIQSNEYGVGRLVYGFMLDTLRSVSKHVCIGSASRRGREVGAYFVLCRDLESARV